MSSHGQPQKITSLPSLQSLVSQMKSSSSFSSRQNHVQSILTIKDPFLYDELINSKGIHILSKWIHDYKESVQGGGDISSEEEELIMDIIDICERCSLSINDLRDTKIGKNIQSHHIMTKFSKRKCYTINQMDNPSKNLKKIRRFYGS